MRKQSLIQNFKVLQMKDSESMQDYCSRVVFIVNQIRGLRYKLSEEEVVAKVLRSLHPKFDFVAVAIEESKDITKLTLDELRGSLQAHEVRVNQVGVKLVEKALHVKGDATDSHYNKGTCSSSESSWGDSRGCERYLARGKERGGREGRGKGYENRSNV